MAKNAPRPSKLAGRSAASPVQPMQEAEPPEDIALAPAPPAPEPKAKSGRNLKKPKVSFYAQVEDEERARAAWLHTAGHTGHKTWTAFLEEAMNSYTRYLEGEYNNQKPFV
jgi:hypothetical protein